MNETFLMELSNVLQSSFETNWKVTSQDYYKNWTRSECSSVDGKSQFQQSEAY